MVVSSETPLPVLHNVVPACRRCGVNLLQKIFDYLLFFVARRSIDPVAAILELVAFVDEQGCIAAIVDNQFRARGRPGV